MAFLCWSLEFPMPGASTGCRCTLWIIIVNSCRVIKLPELRVLPSARAFAPSDDSQSSLVADPALQDVVSEEGALD